MADDTTNYDDGLQNNPDDTNPINDMKRDEKLPEDNTTPFSDPRVQQDKIPTTHPETDSNIDPGERYEEGLAAAAGVEKPKPEDVIPGYEPNMDQRNRPLENQANEHDNS